MTTDSVCILFKKTDFDTISACLRSKVSGWGCKFYVTKVGGHNFLMLTFFVNLGPLPTKMPAPNVMSEIKPLNVINIIKYYVAPKMYFSPQSTYFIQIFTWLFHMSFCQQALLLCDHLFIK